MGSLIGHSIPGIFFFFFGLWYTIKYSIVNLLRNNKTTIGVLQCLKKSPVPLLVIEGAMKIFLISIGIIIEMCVGGPMGRLESTSGSFIQANRWLHTTMYFFFGLAGVCDILSHTAKEIVPVGIERLGASLAFFIEGYLFYFHLDGHSYVYSRVHILLVLTAWACAAFLFVQPFLMNHLKCLHIAETLSVVFIIVQGTWFWQVAYVLFPPGGKPSWDPCSREYVQNGDCNNEEAILNGKFISLFWGWHIAASIILVGIVNCLVYCLLKTKTTHHEYSPIDVKSNCDLNKPFLLQEEEI